MRRFGLSLALTLTLAACTTPRYAEPPPAPQPEATAAPGRRAILVSFDGFNANRLRESLPAEAIPTFTRLIEDGACVPVQPATPSVTAAGHAALWTGSYGGVNGVTANFHPRLPVDEHPLTDGLSGFSAEALRAEPLWITAGRAGRGVVAHHVTQAPGAPGFTPLLSTDSAHAAARHANAKDILTRPSLSVLNGYNRTLERDRVLTEKDLPLRPARVERWGGLHRLRISAMKPLEGAIAVGSDSVHVLVSGGDAYTRLWLSTEQSLESAVYVDLHRTETALVGDRPLARFFSEALPLSVEGGHAFLRARLFEITPDASRFRLFLPAVQMTEANHPEAAAAYAAAVRGWTGNGASSLYRDGAFGPPLTDGTAEQRYLETAELAARGSIRGSMWAWEHLPDLLLDYLSLGDEVDHGFLGLVAPDAPGVSSTDSTLAQRIREHVWALADRKLAVLDSMARADGAALFVTGDHGMRAVWRRFHLNAALREAGLLVLKDDGSVDLSQTRAFSPVGYFVTINRTSRPGGIVSPEHEVTVLDAAEQALRAVRDAAGEPVVMEVYRTDAAQNALGIGGPTGGDLYVEPAPHTALGRGTETVVEPLAPRGAHGFPASAPDMQTALCVEGPGLTAPPARLRLPDVAPTVADWLGIPVPAQATGHSVLSGMKQ